MPKKPQVSKEHSLVRIRQQRVKQILKWLHQVPDKWLEEIEEQKVKESLRPIDCTSYKDLTNYWKKALKWRQDMDDVLSTMLAVAASTRQQGDQIFIMVVGNASGGKSQFCDGMALSPYCHLLENLKGFFSGYRDDEGNDYSLINRVNGKCMITSEGDVIMNQANFASIMAEQRRLFDGMSTASYKNLKEDREYKDQRLTWIMAGTPAMMEKEQASLGDRFLKVFLDSPPDEEKREILRRVSNTAWSALMVNSHEDGSIHTSENNEARQRLAGYVNWLFQNTHKLLDIQCKQSYFDQCENLALLTAILRARPPKSEETPISVEEPHRLNHQFVRLMGCQAFVLNKEVIDDEVMRRVRKVAFNTGHGIIQNIVRLLYEDNAAFPSKSIALELDRTDDMVRKMLRFMSVINAVRTTNGSSQSNGRSRRSVMWKLTTNMRRLCKAAKL